MKVLGIDPSLAGSAVATAHDSARIPTPPDWPMERRFLVISSKIERAAMTLNPDLIVIEGPALMALKGKRHELAGIWWVIYMRLWSITDAGMAILPPTSLKMFATSDGGADKAKVAQAARHHFGNRIVSDDEADATWLAAAGHAALGDPLVHLPAEHTRALSALVWRRTVDRGELKLRDARRALGA